MPTKFNLSSESNDDLMLSPASLDFDKENLSDSDMSNYCQIEAEEKITVELMECQIKRMKKVCAAKVESMSCVKIEVKEELRDVCEEKKELQRQVGLHEGRAEFLTQENEVLHCLIFQKTKHFIINHSSKSRLEIEKRVGKSTGQP